MRTKFAYVLILLLAAAACDKKDDAPENKDAVPVIVSVAPLEEAIPMRSPLNSWNMTSVNMALGESTGVLAGFTTVLDAVVNNNITTFSPQLFYPNNGNTIHLRGYHPRVATISDNKVSYTLTGQEDIMICNTVSGSKSNTIANQGSAGEVTYQHLLTQLNFVLYNNGTFPVSAKVTAIRIHNVSKAASLDLMTGMLTFSDSPTSTFAAYSNPSGIEVSTTPSAKLGYVMFRPGENFTVTVEFNTGDSVVVTDLSPSDIGSQAGYAYSVQLEFSGIEAVTGTMRIVPWNNSGVTNPQMPNNLW